MSYEELKKEKERIEGECLKLAQRPVANTLQGAAIGSYLKPAPDIQARPVLVRLYQDIMSCNYDGNVFLDRAQTQIGLVLKELL